MNIIDMFSGKKSKGEGASEAVATPATPTTNEPTTSVPGDPQATQVKTTFALDDHSIKKIIAGYEAVERRKTRRKWFWRLGVLGSLALVFGMFAPSPTTNETNIEITQTQIGKTLPVIGALPSAKATGHYAVIKLQSGIGGDLGGPPVGGNTPLYLQTALDLAEEDSDLAGVLLYINSPGGGSAASAQAYRIVDAARERLAKKNIQVIAFTSQGIYSGGYYISCGASKIYADPEAQAGNIGVIMHMFNTARLGEMLGIKENIISTGPLKSTGSQWEDLTPAQQKMVRQAIKPSFRNFLLAINKGRHIDMATLEAEAELLENGRTNGGWFSAEDAKQLKLVDEIVPVENLYQVLANSLPDKKKYGQLEFVDYQKKLGLTESMKQGTIHFARELMSVLRTEMSAPRTELRAE